MKLLPLAFLAAAAAAPASPRLVPHSTMIDHFGECMLRRESVRARALMATAPGSPEEMRQMQVLAKRGGDCIKRMYQLGMRSGVMRGAIAGALLRRDPTLVARLHQETPVAPSPVAAIESDRGQVIALAECVAAAAPAEAVDVVRSANASEDERMAIARLQPVLAACAPEAMTLRMDRHDLRSNVADALYRKLHPAVPPANFAQMKD
jgi:hypothetical protein